MGGCRCSYGSCKVRSDGQTHMFHFPVFDKLRCHQWITNSHKPNFLNLKLSQLKNRVICQHHFKDDNFMNYKRDKLKSDAVPTENGPYCVSDQNLIMIEDDMPAIPINVYDIENEKINSVEKKAHSSVKYGDFLISDVTELFNSSHNSIESQAIKKVPFKRNCHAINTTKSYQKDSLSKYKLQNQEDNHNYTIIYDEQPKPTNMMNSSNNAIVSVEYEDASFPNKSLKLGRQGAKETQNTNLAGNPNVSMKPINTDNVIILSEQTISEPVLFEGKLKPLSPSMILRKPARKLKSSVAYNQSNLDIKPQLKNEENFINVSVPAINNNFMPQEQTIMFAETVPIEYAPKEMENILQNHLDVQENINDQLIQLNAVENEKNTNDEDCKQNELPIQEVFLNCMLKTAEKLTEPEYTSQSNEKSIVTPICTPVFKSVLKNKITPEKLAAIEQKRKFNLKLRDVISSCLDNLDNHKPVISKNTSPGKKQAAKRILRSAPTSPNPKPQGSMIAYLEARLQRMEDTLLNKIDHNTQRINELKRTIKPSSNSRNANTQTYLNHMSELSQKQYLYKEIAKFLSPSANVKVYEELFVDTTPPKGSETATPRKLRKRR